MKLMVLNLPRDFNKLDLIKLFKTHCEIEECHVVMDENTYQSKGFAFVTMKDETEALAAIEALHQHKIGKKKIRVKQAD
jgi:RNA recognition motif-containing protein